MKNKIYLGKMIDEENDVCLSVERIGEVVGISLSTRIDDSLIERGNQLLSVFLMLDPDIFNDNYRIVGNEFIYTLYLSVHCIDNNGFVFELVNNHFYSLLNGIKELKTRKIKESCDQIYKEMFLSD